MIDARNPTSVTAETIDDAALLLQRLAQPGAYVAAAAGQWRLNEPGPRILGPRPRIALAVVETLRNGGRLVSRVGGGLRLAHDRAAHVQQVSDRRPPRGEREAAGAPLYNDAESPLAWLRARKDRAGRPLLGAEQFMAGERLRADYERSALAARVTADWSSPAARRGGGPGAMTITDAAIAARQRYHAALSAVGEELASILVQVCCLAAGIEQAERILDLPQRSGRAVLGLALTALARHYGYGGKGRSGPAAPGHWAMPDYRPEIPPPAE